MFKNLRAYENLHITLWLIKDACWVRNYHLGGMLMIIPTLLVSLHITWRTRKNLHDLFHNVAVSLWICANGTWMAGEFYCDDCTRDYAAVFFALGLAVVAFYYLFIFPKRKNELNENSNELHKDGMPI